MRGVNRWYCQPYERSLDHEQRAEDHAERAVEADELEEPHRRDHPDRRHPERWRHADNDVMRFTDPPGVFQATRLAPLRVTEVRHRQTTNSADSAPIVSQLQKSESLSNSPVQPNNHRHHHLSDQQFDISERSLRCHNPRPSDPGTRISDNRWAVRRIRSDSEDMYRQRVPRSWHDKDFRPRSSDDRGAENQYDSWDSPSSLRSSLDGSSHLAAQLDGWHGLRVDSPAESSPSSGSPAHSASVHRQHDDVDMDAAVSREVRPAPPVKQSRYLREMDRRIILLRLTKGEKQAALAKEYGVSRSTICNLLKQKDIVLARKDENPLSRHPKKTRLARSKHAPPVGTSNEATALVQQHTEIAARQASRTTKGDDELESKRAEPAQQTAEFLSFDTTVVIEVQSRAMSLLKTTLHNRETSDSDFKRCYTRLMRLLMEEAIGIVASRSPQGRLPDLNDPNADQSPFPSRRVPSFVDSVCAIAIGESGTPLLDTFRLLEPEASTGFIGASLTASQGLELHIVSHPNDVIDRDVLLLDMVLASGDSACAAISLLRLSGVREDRITIVALFVATEVVALVQYAHPSVRILTAGIDMQLHQRVGKGRGANDSASSSRVFLERFLSVSQ